MSKATHAVMADIDDLLFVFGSALRYGLGRRTYSTSLISGFITDNISLLNEKWFINFLRDINDYEETRIRWSKYKITNDGEYDSICDYESWINLKATLVNEYEKRGFENSLAYYGIELTEMKLFAVTENERRYIHTCATLAEARNLIYSFCEERGFEGFTYKIREEKNTIQFFIEQIPEIFHLELWEICDKTLSKLFGSVLPYRGRDYRLGGVPGKKSFFDNAFCVPVDFTSEQIKIACMKIYRNLAREDITTKVQKYAPQIGIEDYKIKINGAKTKLGSYTSNNIFNFSWRLVMGTDEIIDYVIVYTLVQAKEKKGLPRFWATISDILPDYRNCQKMLNVWRAGLKDEIL